MGADNSRRRFDPEADFATVLMQQGRVQLDADWNELVEIFERRVRAGTVDLTSQGPSPDRAGTAVVPRQTPDGFKIDAGGGALTIGRGRIYVDGLLAENHGGGKETWDAVLAEAPGQDPLPFAQQPYHPRPERLPPRGPHLVYLEVWQRDVTQLERPDLVEIAVGVDTTTRQQTMWQVRLLADVGEGVTCNTPDAQIPGWLDVIRPSAGRLSTRAEGVESDEDPCVLPPTGGYRGIENHLYRIEIHDGGPVGQATFKWSRENASVASAIPDVLSSTELRVASLGRDAVLRFKTGDWVEIIDDWRELSGKPTAPFDRQGEIRQITVDEARSTITFGPALPADMVPGGGPGDTPAERHLRVRRWDQKGKIRQPDDDEWFDLDASGSQGVIPVPPAGTPVMLEHGIQVDFSLAETDGHFRGGDYWVFAARTADTSIEELDQAPPCGLHRHYARLALVTFPEAETDCRTLWPPAPAGESCACAVCVTPESHRSGALTLQKAIDDVKETGGTVCLAGGDYVLGDDGVVIEQAQAVRVKGQGRRTMLVASGRAITVRSSAGVAIEDLSVTSSGARGEPVVSFTNCLDVSAERLSVVVRADAGNALAPAIGLGGVLVNADLCDNTIAAPTGIGGPWGTEPEPGYLATLGLRIEGQFLMCARRAIALVGPAFHAGETRIAGSTLVGGREAGVAVTGAVFPGSGVAIEGNTITSAGAAIVGGTDGLRIERNTITGGEAERGGDGIVLAPGFDPSGIDRCQVTANQIIGLNGAAIAVRALVRSAVIQQNLISATGAGIVFDDRGSADAIRVEGNHLINVAPSANAAGAAPVAIRVQSANSVEIEGNTVHGVGRNAVQGIGRIGIQTVACRSVRIASNDVAEIGPAEEFVRVAIGIDVHPPFDRLDINDNAVRRDLVAGDPASRSAWIALRVHATAAGTRTLLAPKVSLINVDDETLLLLLGSHSFVLVRGRDVVATRGNLLEARGGAPVATLTTTADCVLNDNRCLQMSQWSTVVLVGASSLIAQGNRVRGGEASMALNVDPKRVTVVGNVTSTPIAVSGAALLPPWNALNVVAV